MGIISEHGRHLSTVYGSVGSIHIPKHDIQSFEQQTYVFLNSSLPPPFYCELVKIVSTEDAVQFFYDIIY